MRVILRSFPSRTLLPRNCLRWIPHTYLLLFPVASALRPAIKYFDSFWLWIAYVLAFLLVLLAGFVFPDFIRSITSKYWVLVLTGAFALVSSSFYPAADNLKILMRGQDQDDCTILVAKQLLALDFPYDQLSYFGNPCSPLPGAVIPYLPFVAVNAYLLANGAFLILTVLFLQNRLLREDFRVGALTVLIILAIPQTLELMVNGSDFIFIGFAILAIVISIEYPPKNLKLFYLVSVLAGLVASSRISLVVVALAFLISLYFNSKQPIISNVLITLSVTIIPSTAIFLVSPEKFSPLHLVEKGSSLLPGSLMLAMILITGVLIGFSFLNNKVRKNPSVIFLLIVSPQIVFLSLGDLFFWRLGDFATWEGASYWSILTPLLAYHFSRKYLKLRSHPS
jgi:hypothetical protein